MSRPCWILAVGLAAAMTACGGETFDWEQSENFMLQKKAEEQPDGSVKMTFVGLVKANPQDFFKALSDVEHHDQFIEDVMEVKLVSATGNKKVVDIRNRVLGRPNQARIEWTIDEAAKRVSFKTLQANFTDNSAEYQIEGSPDGTRTRTTTIYYLRDKGGHPFPLHTLKAGIEESYIKAVNGVKRRALGMPPGAAP